jgi:uncharacterized protein
MNEFYYFIKPWIPRSVQIRLRNHRARLKFSNIADNWPIDEAAGSLPSEWKGWPEGKRFALVLTHDVERSEGRDNSGRLARLEMEHGFRSSFNFVPGDYVLDDELRHYLVSNGFEVGVHGYTHKQGNIFKSESHFAGQAIKINGALREWGAVGFRAPCMYHDLEKVRSLSIEYDASTFDTDPLEPQPDGVQTIFPFWVGDRDGNGFVELPYTLPQDFTIFSVMKENNIRIWKRKVDWIADKGGMALLLVHPDYLNFKNQDQNSEEFPVRLYEDFLEYLKLRYHNQYWHVLPRTMAGFWKENYRNSSGKETGKLRLGFGEKEKNRGRIKSVNDATFRYIWIDLDNTPHVPFFSPIIRELEKIGRDVRLTARNCSQTCGMADLYQFQYKRIGQHHYGKNKLAKIAGTLFRSIQLKNNFGVIKPALALSHGSRAQLIAAKLMRIPSLLIFDYEHASDLILPDYFMMPDLISPDFKRFTPDKLLRYPGIKEDVYVPEFRPDPRTRDQLGVDEDKILVTIRPPAIMAHYHNPESEALFAASIERVSRMDQTRMVILPRYESQAEMIRRLWKEQIHNRKIIMPENVVEGLNLLFASDVVISGGGTMNREAAALGVPVYSIFRGKLGEVDRFLSEQGRLVLLESVEDVQSKLKIEKRVIPAAMVPTSRAALNAVVEGILKVLN